MIISKFGTLAPALAVGALFATSASFASNVSTSGDVTTLTFGGQVNATTIGTFFDGGSDGYGTIGGAANNVGVTFSSPAEFLNPGISGTGFNGGSGRFENAPNGATGVLYMASVPVNTTPILDDASGFSGISVNYSLYNNVASYGSTVQLWSGLDGTGTEVGTLTLSAASGSPMGCTPSNDYYCVWSAASNQTLTGTAESAVFTGDSRTYTEFSDVALTAPVPLPAAAWLMLSGAAGVLGLSRRRGARAA